LKFNKLRLSGFKSFVDPVELHIEPGLTGVVGPNGCGKSNLLEALRWVMGEASYKAMRGSGMEDVIFSGSANRPARNMAEVVATMDNSDRTASAAFNKDDVLEISRRIERDAGSAYRINGRDTRARDVQLLFADASTGAHSPSLVRQGQISEIINAKPQARRKVLEEAAGISGLHQRRHEAELRLRAAENNLLRLEDVINELDAQHSALKRQARQASRYRNLSSGIRKAEALLLHLKWQDTTEAATQCLNELKDVRARVGKLTEAAANATARQLEAAEKLPGLREREAIEAAVLNRLNTELATLEAEARQAAERKGELSALLEQVTGDLAREKTIQSDMSAALSRLAVEEEELKVGMESRAKTHQDAAAALEARRAELAKLEQAHETLGAEQAARRAEGNALKARLEDIRRKRERLAAQLEASKQKLAEARARHDETSFDALAQGAREAEEKLHGAEQESLQAETARERADKELIEKRRKLENARREAQALQTEAKTLERMLVAEGAGEWPRLIEQLQPDTGYEKALAALLGDDLDGALDENAPVHWRNLPRLDALNPLPEGAECLQNVVKAPDSLTARLLQTGVVPADQGAALQRRLKPGQRLVSRAGDLWRWDGFVSAADAPTAAAKRMEGRNRLEILHAKLASANEQVSFCQQAHEAAREAANAARKDEKARRASWRERQGKASLAAELLAKAQRQAQDTLLQIKTLEEAGLRLATEIAELDGELTDKQEALLELTQPEDDAGKIEILRQKRDAARSALASAQAAFEGLERDARQREQRLATIARERGEWDRRAARADEQIAILTRRIGAAEQDLERISTVPDELVERRNKLASSISRAQNAHVEATDARAAGEKRQAECDRAARDAERELSGIREQLGRAEIRVEAAVERRTEAGARIAEQLECAPEKAIFEAGFAPGDPLPEAAQALAKLEKLKAERERLGGVNLRAGEEAEEISRRLEGMRHESDDLEKAIAKLRAGIGHLNREGRTRLLEAFEEVNGHFKDLFTKLFGGGKAELKLTESDDPLEAGLEIEARPPGKRPQTMSLLSGGEQALTALSLIFAVFLTNPSPICVLDEIDAPLDDANVERVCDLLDKMAKMTDTRFLIITHHPYTMARMNRLFGVTMAEKGVSQLVSVDLETAERIRDTG
jgi:chromosome segregation protein